MTERDFRLVVGVVQGIAVLFVALLLVAAIQHNGRIKCLEKDIANRAVLCAPQNPQTPAPPAKPLELR